MPAPPTNAPPPPDGDEGRRRTSLAVPVLVVAVAAGLIGAIIWVARSEQDAGASVLAGTTVAGPLPVTVPFREVGGAVVIDVTLGEGSRTVPMILDTGAPTTVSEQVAGVFGGESSGTIAGAAVDGQTITSDVVPLSQVALGDAVFRDVGAMVRAIEPGDPFYCITDSGSIGASLMQAAVWQVDPTTSTVTIATAIDALDLEGATRFEFTGANDVSPAPLFELPAGEGVMALLLDTGSAGWLAVHPTALESLGLALPAEAPTQRILATGTAGAFATRVHWLSAQVSLGAGAQTLPMAALDALAEGPGNVGMDFLRHFILTIDWPGGAFYLEPVSEVVPATPSNAGLAWDDGYVLGSYFEGRPETEVLELGAPISAIDGEPVTSATFDDYCTRVVRGEGPSEYEVTLTGDAPTTVEIVPLDGFFESLTVSSAP